MQNPIKIKHNSEIYQCFVGSDNVLIKSPDGISSTVDKKKIKGRENPSLMRRLMSFGKKIKIENHEVEKFVRENY
jgi:hypothetical protein